MVYVRLGLEQDLAHRLGVGQIRIRRDAELDEPAVAGQVGVVHEEAPVVVVVGMERQPEQALFEAPGLHHLAQIEE